MDLLPLLLVLAAASFTATNAFVPTNNAAAIANRRGGATSPIRLHAAANHKKRGGRRGQPRRGNNNDSITYGIGLGWEEHWEQMYQQLLMEKSFHAGAEGFKLGYVENTRLWFWLHIQKENLRRGVMRQDRKQKLMELGYQVAGGAGDAATDVKGANNEELMFAPTPPPVTTSTTTTTSTNTDSNKWLQEFVRELQFAPKPPPVTNSNPQESSPPNNVNWLT